MIFDMSTSRNDRHSKKTHFDRKLVHENAVSKISTIFAHK